MLTFIIRMYCLPNINLFLSNSLRTQVVVSERGADTLKMPHILRQKE
jgi:hypothetical protein